MNIKKIPKLSVLTIYILTLLLNFMSFIQPSKVLADYSGPFDLQVTKTLSGSMTIGQTADFVINYTNSGTSNLNGLYVKDNYLSGLIYVGVVSSNPSVISSGINFAHNSTTRNLIRQGMDLGPNQTGQLVVRFFVNTGTIITGILNTGLVYATYSGCNPISETGSLSAFRIDYVLPLSSTGFAISNTPYDLKVVKSVISPTPVAEGDLVTYQIDYFSTKDKTDIYLEDIFPKELQFSGIVSASPNLPGYTLVTSLTTGNKIIWRNLSLSGNTTGTIQLQFRVKQGLQLFTNYTNVGTTLNNGRMLIEGGVNGETNAGNNASSVDVDVKPFDLRIRKSISLKNGLPYTSGTFTGGDTVTFQLAYHNSGYDRSDIAILDTRGSIGLKYISASVNPKNTSGDTIRSIGTNPINTMPTYSNNNVLLWTGLSLANNTTGFINITYQVLPGCRQAIPNNAFVSISNPYANNSFMQLSSSPGQYTGNWTLGSILTNPLTLRTNGPFTKETNQRNNSGFVSLTTHTCGSGGSITTTTFDLSVSKSHNDADGVVYPGQEIEYTLKYHNNGPRHGHIYLDDTFDAGLTYLGLKTGTGDLRYVWDTPLWSYRNSGYVVSAATLLSNISKGVIDNSGAYMDNIPTTGGYGEPISTYTGSILSYCLYNNPGLYQSVYSALPVFRDSYLQNYQANIAQGQSKWLSYRYARATASVDVFDNIVTNTNYNLTKSSYQDCVTKGMIQLYIEQGFGTGASLALANTYYAATQSLKINNTYISSYILGYVTRPRSDNTLAPHDLFLAVYNTNFYHYPSINSALSTANGSLINSNPFGPLIESTQNMGLNKSAYDSLSLVGNYSNSYGIIFLDLTNIVNKNLSRVAGGLTKNTTINQIATYIPSFSTKSITNTDYLLVDHNAGYYFPVYNTFGRVISGIMLTHTQIESIVASNNYSDGNRYYNTPTTYIWLGLATALVIQDIDSSSQGVSFSRLQLGANSTGSTTLRFRVNGGLSNGTILLNTGIVATQDDVFDYRTTTSTLVPGLRTICDTNDDGIRYGNYTFQSCSSLTGRYNTGILFGWGGINFTGESIPGLNNVSASQVTLSVPPVIDVSVNKVSSGTNFTLGSNVAYGISYCNSGVSIFTGELQDIYPAGLNFVSAAGTLASPMPFDNTSTRTLIWNNIVLNLGECKAGIVTFQIDTGYNATSITNMMQLGAQLADGAGFTILIDSNPLDNISNAPINIIQPPTISPNFTPSGTKTSVGTYRAGSIITYSLVISNTKTIAALFNIVDSYGSGLTFVGLSGLIPPGLPILYHDLANRTVSWGGYNIPANTTRTIQLSFIINTELANYTPIYNAFDATYSTLSNIDCTGGDTNLINNISIVRSIRNNIGGTVYFDNDKNYTYNPISGDNGLSGYLVYLYSGNILTNTSFTNNSGNYLFTGLADGNYLVTYTNSGLFIPLSANTGSISGNQVGFSSGLFVISNIILTGGATGVNYNFGLGLPSAINGTVWYDMNADTNTGGETFVSGAKLSITYNNSIEGTVTKTVYTDSDGNWSVTGLQTGSTYSVNLDMTFGPANGYRITTNNVNLSGVVGYSQSLHVSHQGLYLTNVRINKTVDVTDATIGDVITYTINYSNNSSGTAYNVSVYDLFPFDFLAINNSTPIFSSPAFTVGLNTPTTLTYNIGTLVPGQSGSIAILAVVTTGTDAQIINNLGAIDTAGTGNVTGRTISVTTGSITINNTGTIETTSGDNTSTALVTIYRIDLNILKDADHNVVGPNDVFEYTLHIGNNTGIVKNVIVIDTLDPNLVYIGMSTGTLNGEPSISGQILTWSGITLAPNSTNTIKILVKPKQYLSAGTILTNNVIIGRINNIGIVIPLYETNTTNNASSVQVILSGTNYITIAGNVYFDQNADKSINGSDIYISGVVVNLLSGNTIIANTITNNSGGYIFTGLIAGNYDITYTYPNEYIPFTSKGGFGASTNGFGSIDSGSISITGIVSNILADGNNSINNNFGLIKSSSIAGIIYHDLANNLNKDPIDILLANQSVMISGSDVFGNIINLTTITNSSGAYLFANLMPGVYSVSYTNSISNLNPLASFTGSVGALSKTLQTINNIDLLSNMNAIDYDFSLGGTPSSIAGQIYLDANLNKINNSNEIGLAGFTVNLSGINILGNSVNLTTNVDSGGKYLFSELADGVYSVSYINNSEYISYIANTGTILSVNVGNVINTTGINNIRIFYGQDSINNDFGLVQTSTIAGIVYQDLDKSKSINSEPGLVGQIVYLNGIDILGNNVSINTITNNDGQYIFNTLIPGDYSISYNNTYSNLSPFVSNPGSIAGNSNGYQVINAIDLKGNINAINYNFGLIETIYKQTIAGNVYLDKNSSNILDNGDLKYISGAIVILSGIDLSGNLVNVSTVASINGAYKFTNLSEGTYDIYLDKSSVVGYIHHVANAGNIAGSGNGIVNNLKIESIILGLEQDSIENNFGLTHMDLTISISISPKQGKAGDTVILTITYSNQGIADSDDTVIELSSTNGLIIDPADLTKNIGTLTPGQNGSYTINVKIANDANIILNTLDVNSHIYSNSTPELDILTNYSKDSILVVSEELYSIAGNVYDDQDASKYKSAVDLVYNSANIYINGNDRFGRLVSAMSVIGSDGKYIFTGLIAGSYKLSITNLNSNYLSVSSNAGTINGFIVGNGSTENISGIKTQINLINLSSNGIDYNFGVVKTSDPIKPSGTTYNPTPVIEISVPNIQKEEVIVQKVIVEEIAKESKQIIVEKIHEIKQIVAEEMPEDMIFGTLPKTGVN